MTNSHQGKMARSAMETHPSSCVLLCELKEEEGEPMETHPTSVIKHSV